ncbi:MAG: M1 family aminopeptidase [Ignavibacteria bacterium]
MKETAKITLILLLLISGLSRTFSQVEPNKSKSGSGIHAFNTQNTAITYTFDVLDYKLFLDIRNCFFSPYPNSFNAVIVIKFIVDSTLNSISLNAVNSSLHIDSVGFSGVSYTHLNNLLNVMLDRTYNPGETVFVKIYYDHLNTFDQAFYASNGFVVTDCEPERARNWFPCRDKPSDKATTDITVKVPSNVRLGSNGSLADSTLTGDTLYYHWVSRDPMSTYLVSLAGGINYKTDILYWHKLSSPSDSIPIRLYFSPGENNSAIKNIIIGMSNYYSGLFGDYAFEKIGMASIPGFISPFCGGMENQTLIHLFCSGWDIDLVSHEFGHSWFGDAITCGTWADVWLNEGFATYCQALWSEHTQGHDVYMNRISDFATNYFLNNPGWAMYNPEWAVNTPSSDILFNYAITYARGACVLHMLRYTLGDSLFFSSLKAYATDTADFKYKNAVTDEFTSKISAASGTDISWFIDEWVKQPNHPVYQNIYNINKSGNNSWNVNFTAAQVQTNTVFHKMPLVLKITFYDGSDSLIKVFNGFNNQQWSWTMYKHPVEVVFDPDNGIILKQGTTTPGPNSESLYPGMFNLYQNYPNPFNPNTSINYDVPVKSNITIKIYNTAGELVTTLFSGQKLAGKYSIIFNGSNYASGIYFYELDAEGFNITYKAVKKMALVK